MRIAATELPEVVLVECRMIGDERGFFMETWNQREFDRLGIPGQYVQDNHSRSVRNTLRGLHYQLDRPQGKLVRVARGRIFDVAVDLRQSSSTFRKWTGYELSDDNSRQLWIPPGFAHGFYVLSECADVVYKVTDYFDPADQHCVLWNDADLQVTWPLQANSAPVLSARDRNGLRLSEARLFN
jgi:dTDP-4-dehydrorhamnose 3,5-epimerase